MFKTMRDFWIVPRIVSMREFGNNFSQTFMRNSYLTKLDFLGTTGSTFDYFPERKIIVPSLNL
jgi:hypothetical protein